ncbi:MAG TPA: hypothetical protein VMF91_26290 [Bryobacteraceae bacterium]|nr:hypothetical protein [Bryobacteraceae bacterium]
MTQKIRRRIEALESAAPQSIWTAVHLTDDEIIDRAIERLSDQDLEVLGQLSNDSEESCLPTAREGAALYALGCAIEQERGCLKLSPQRRYAG